MKWDTNAITQGYDECAMKWGMSLECEPLSAMLTALVIRTLVGTI